MAGYQTTGIIIGRFNLGEADRIITFITPDHGKLRAVARGVRRIKSRMAGHLELFCRSQLMLAVGRNLDVITSVRLENHPDKLAEDYEQLSYAYLFAEILDKLTEEGEAHPAVFKLLDEALSALDQGQGGQLLELWFKLRLAAELGYRPQLRGCVVCGRRDEAADYFFNPALGGIVDAACRQAADQPMPVRQIKLWRLLLQQDWPKLAKVGEAAGLAEDGLSLCDDFYEHVFGRRFRLAAVLK